MSDKKQKSGLDSLFDIAEDMLGGVESVLGPGTPAPPPPPPRPPMREFKDLPPVGKPASQKQVIIDAESKEVERSRDWEKTWEQELSWAVSGVPGSTGEGWHVFKEASLRAEGCGQTFQSHEVRDRQKLANGRRILACTSCINFVSQKG